MNARYSDTNWVGTYFGRVIVWVLLLYPCSQSDVVNLFSCSGIIANCIVMHFNEAPISWRWQVGIVDYSLSTVLDAVQTRLWVRFLPVIHSLWWCFLLHTATYYLSLLSTTSLEHIFMHSYAMFSFSYRFLVNAIPFKFVLHQTSWFSLLCLTFTAYLTSSYEYHGKQPSSK